MLPKLKTPTYEVNLISTGESVKFRPFLVGEQKIFLMAAESKDVKDTINAIKQVLKNCILDKNIDIETLPTFDLEYLFLQLRARSVGEISELRYTCNNRVLTESGEEKVCGGIIKMDINLLDIQPITSPEHNNKIMLTDELGVVLKYPTLNMLQKLNIQSETDILKIVSSCIDYIFDKDQIYYAKDSSPKELEEFIDSMQQNDLDKIKQFFQTMPKLAKQLDFKCNKCGYEEDITIEGVQNFFS